MEALVDLELVFDCLKIVGLEGLLNLLLLKTGLADFGGVLVSIPMNAKRSSLASNTIQLQQISSSL